MTGTLSETKAALLAAGEHRTCGECGKGIAKAQRIHKGVPICVSCYHRIFMKKHCSRCGSQTVVHKNDPAPICHACVIKDRSCLRCGKLVVRAGLLIGDQAACASCAPYFRDKKPCPRCDTLSARLSRVAGLCEEPVCETCQRRLSYATCGHCGKSRKQHFCRLNREILCKVCTEEPDACHDCPDCGTLVGGAGDAPCLACATKRSLRKKQHFLRSTLTNDIAVSLSAEFIDWACNGGHAAKVSQGFAAYAEFFTRIEASSVGMVNDEAVKKHFSVEELRRLGYVTQFLSEQGYLLASGADRQAWSEERRIDDILQEAKTLPCGDVLVEYAAWLDGRTGKPLAIRTKRVYLRASTSWLSHAAIIDLDQLANSHLQAFLKASPGQRASLTSFLHFLGERYGVLLKVESRKKKKGKSIESRKAQLAERLLSALQQDFPVKTKQACLAKLLSTLYTLPLETVLALPRKAVTTDGKKMQLVVHEVVINLDARITPFLSYYLLEAGSAGRRDDRLFQGRNTSDSLSTSAVVFHLKKLEETK
jgi:hypothetical protein